MVERRFSRQRERIYQAVCAARSHPTAQMVYDDLKQEFPKLSLGTVYRNLHQMAEEGRLAELEGPVARFDAITVPHSHMHCERCGQVADVDLPDDPELDQMAGMAGMTSGWTVHGHSLIFRGICPVCAGE